MVKMFTVGFDIISIYLEILTMVVKNGKLVLV